jgi:phosphoglycolate phosphatase
VVFDLDGTLIDSREDIAAAANAARRSLGLADLPLPTVVSYVGDGAETLIERLTPGCAPAQRAQALAAFKAHYAVHCCDATRPYPGVPEALAALAAAGWALGVATNKPDAFAAEILRRLGLGQRFGAVAGGDGAKKPDPASVRTVLARLGADAASSWMAGDHHTDIRAGRAAGCRVLWCAWGIGGRDGLAVDAEASAASDLPLMLGR